VPAAVEARKRLLMGLALALSVAACSRSTSAPDQTESGVAAPPAGAASAVGATLPASSGHAGRDASIGGRIDDSVITTKVKAMLVADGEIKGSDINVETRNGDVVLSGFVDSEEQGEKAIDAVRRVNGVKEVDSRLSIRK